MALTLYNDFSDYVNGIDRINENPDSYKNVVYVIENMQSGELGKGVEESLTDKGYDTQRVIFTNFPKSIEGVDSIPDVLAYNKNLVTPDSVADSSSAATSKDMQDELPEPTKSPGFTIGTILIALGAGSLVHRRAMK